MTSATAFQTRKYAKMTAVHDGQSVPIHTISQSCIMPLSQLSASTHARTRRGNELLGLYTDVNAFKLAAVTSDNHCPREDLTVNRALLGTTHAMFTLVALSVVQLIEASVHDRQL